MAGSGELTAVLDIGSSAFRLMVVSRLPDGGWDVVDRAEKPVPIGREVFSGGRISRETLARSVQVLGGFRELLDGWHIDPKDALIIGTSALREARNGDTFVDRVALRTGLQIEVIGEVEESQLTYLAVRHALTTSMPRWLRSHTLIVEVGAGHVTLIRLKGGSISTLHTLKIGTVRMERPLQAAAGTSTMRRVITESLGPTLGAIEQDMRLRQVSRLVAVGGDMRLAADHAGEPVGELAMRMTRAQFEGFVERTLALPVPDAVDEFQISYSEAELLAPGLLMQEAFLQLTGAREVIVPRVSIRDGLLLDREAERRQSISAEFHDQVIAGAVSLGERYRFDQRHGRHTAFLACRLFDQLQDDHGLDSSQRLLLEVAAILHDVGKLIRASAHHKHGHYIVSNSEIFGLDASHQAIVANVVRYHRRALPSPSHIPYVALPRHERIVVSKLAALLRVADALDRSHDARVRDLLVRRGEGELIIGCDYQGDLSLKALALQYKGDLFEEVFGMRVRLETLSADTNGTDAMSAAAGGDGDGGAAHAAATAPPPTAAGKAR